MQLDKSKARDIMLERKRSKKLTWEELGKALNRSPVYVAMLLYGYEQATKEEAEKLVKILELPPEYKDILMEVPHEDTRTAMVTYGSLYL